MTARLKRARGAVMGIDEFLELHRRLVTDESTAIDADPERRFTDGEPPNGKERRHPKKGDQRPKRTSAAGLRWLKDYRKWERASERFRQLGGKRADALKVIDETAWA